jgi:hypothetical protein
VAEMRLIDADKFCNFVNENCTDNLAGLWCELINMQPTAYDTDKVISYLEAHRDAWEDGHVLDKRLVEEKVKVFDFVIKLIKETKP